jgi:hypothetical protein
MAGTAAAPVRPARNDMKCRMRRHWVRSAQKKSQFSLTTKSLAGMRAASHHFHLVMIDSAAQMIPMAA